MPAWEHFSHDADIGLIGIGPTKAEAFRQAAIALTAVVTDPERVNTVTSVDIASRAPGDELLLVEWLNALIYEMAAYKDVGAVVDAADRAGLSRRIAKLEPLVCIKGWIPANRPAIRPGGSAEWR